MSMRPLIHRSKTTGGGELKRVLVLMAPLYLANLMSVGMGVVDTIVAGQAGTADLAAVALGTSITTPVMVSVGAVLSIIGPMVARLLGAREAAQRVSHGRGVDLAFPGQPRIPLYNRFSICSAASFPLRVLLDGGHTCIAFYASCARMLGGICADASGDGGVSAGGVA